MYKMEGEFIPCNACKKDTTFPKGSKMDISGRPVYCVLCYKPREGQREGPREGHNYEKRIPPIQMDETGARPVSIPPQAMGKGGKKDQKKTSKYDKNEKREPRFEQRDYQRDQPDRPQISDSEKFLRIAQYHTREELIRWIDAAEQLGKLKQSPQPAIAHTTNNTVTQQGQ